MTPDTDETAADRLAARADAPGPGRPRDLTRDVFDALLARLDADRDVAGDRYLELRRKLTSFFDRRGCPFPEDHADETLNRVARRVFNGEAILHTTAYVLGTARLLALEIYKEQARERRALGELAQAAPPDAGPDPGESRARCLRHCLAGMSSGNRELILEYYRGERSAKIENRKRLTARLQLSINTLRMRALRLRESLQACVEQCVARDVLPSDATSG